MNSRHPNVATNTEARTGQPPRGRLYQFMANEHVRLDHLLVEPSERTGVTVIESYQRFREGLLRHIGIEEKILLPAAQRCTGGVPLRLAERLRLDHGALAAMMMLPPSASTFRTVRAVLDVHNPLEEAPDGVYDQCEMVIGDELDEILTRCEAAAKVPVSPWIDSRKVLAVAKRMLIRAGYDGSLLDRRDED